MKCWIGGEDRKYWGLGRMRGYCGGLQEAGKCPQGVLEVSFPPISGSTSSRKPFLSPSLTKPSHPMPAWISVLMSVSPQTWAPAGQGCDFWVSFVLVSPVPRWMPDASKSSIKVWWINEIWWGRGGEEGNSMQGQLDWAKEKECQFSQRFADTQKAIQKYTSNRCLKVRNGWKSYITRRETI